jgi:hypothetical protein
MLAWGGSRLAGGGGGVGHRGGGSGQGWRIWVGRAAVALKGLAIGSSMSSGSRSNVGLYDSCFT